MCGGQVCAGIGQARESVGEAGAVVDVGGSVAAPGKDDVAADVERVALIVIERRKPCRQGKIS